MFKIRFGRLGIAMAVVCMMLTVGTTIWAFDGAKNISVIYRNIGIVVNGAEVKSTQGEPFIYEGRTYVPLRAVAEALGTEVSWDGQANRVHINGKVDLNGKLYYQSATAIAYPVDSKSLEGYINIVYTVLVVNATDQPFNSVSLSCKAFTKEGKLLQSTARAVSDGLKARSTRGLEWSGGGFKATTSGDLNTVCELATPMG
jgi:hypothetical protein